MATNGVITVPINSVDHESASSVALLQSFLAAHPDVRFIRYYANDYCNLLRTRFTPTARALQMAAKPRSGIATGSPIVPLGLQAGGIIIELVQPAEDIWVPDWTTLREFGASKGTATVMCNVEEHVREKEGQDSMLARDPRTRLQKVVRDAKAKHDVDFLVGTEIEFVLVESPSATESIVSPPGVWTSAATRVSHWQDIVEASVEHLEAAGVHVWGFCQEGGNSKYEISLSPLPPVEAVDAMHYAHETIKTMAKKHGVHATMHAKAFEDGPTAGKHVHISLSKPEMGTPWLAGVMKHFRALCGFMQSNVDSYKRGDQFGHNVVSWAWDNKSACMKRIQDAYFEIRPPDSFANMYMMLAAIIGVGLRGVEDDEELTIKSFDDVCFAAPPTEEQRKKFNIKDSLPKDLQESIIELKADTVIKEILGEKCFDAYVFNKEKDLEACKKMSAAERRKALIEQY